MTVTLHAQSSSIDSLKSVLSGSTAKSDTTRAIIYNNLSKEWSSINFDTSLAYANLAYTIAVKNKYKQGIAESFVNKGWLLVNTGKLAQGYESYSQALGIYNEINDPKGKASAYDGWGVTYVMLKRYPEAIQYFLRALSIYEKLNLKKNMSMTLFKVGSAYQKMRDYKRAFDSFNKALKLAEQESEPKTAADAYNNIAGIYRETKQYDKCIETLFKSKQLAEQSNSMSALATAYLTMGTVYSETNQLQLADTSLQKALALFIRLKSSEQIARTYYRLANWASLKREYTKAANYFFSSNEIARRLNNYELQFDNYRRLIEISKAKDELTKMGGYYERMVALKDAILTVDKNNNIAVLKASHEVEKKQMIINEEKRDIAEKTRQRESLLIVTGSGILLALVLVFCLFTIIRKHNTINKRTRQLAELNALKDKFFSILGYELRSPISNIRSSLNLLSPGNVVVAEEDRKVLFENLKSSTTSVLDTMDNLFMWGQQQLHNIKRAHTRINVQEVTERVYRYLQPSAENKSIRIINKIETPIIVTADKDQLEFVLINLISNALKFSYTDNKVEIRAREIDGWVNIYVKDFGTGMTKEIRDKIFDINNRQSEKGTSGEIGSGLGLILCKEFITQNNGTLTVKSEEGIGTTFAIKLPGVSEDSN
jgi:signal transduction histidine kinase